MAVPGVRRAHIRGVDPLVLREPHTGLRGLQVLQLYSHHQGLLQ